MLSPQKLLDYFFTRFKERHGVPMLVNGGRDMKLMKAVIAAYGDAALELVDEFFEKPSEWVEKSGFTIPIFYSECNNIVSRRKTENYYASITHGVSGENPEIGSRSRKEHHITVLEGGDGGPRPSPIRKTREGF
jgi:hypothetical protein